MEHIRHMKPREVDPDMPFGHIMLIEEDGVPLGSVHYEYYSRPFPLYFLGHIEIDANRHGSGLGTQLMDAFEKKLIVTDRAGLLSENMRTNRDEFRGWYRRRGWQQVPGTNAYVFNVPRGVTIDSLGAPDVRTRIFSDERYRRVARRLEGKNHSAQ